VSFFEFCEFLSDKIVLSCQDDGLIGFFLEGLDFVFDDFEELDGFVEWLDIGEGFALVIKGVCEFGV
jgi:hypothetical protein